MTFDPADERLLRAYQNNVGAPAETYLRDHYRRYKATLAFLRALQPSRILELGVAAPYLFTLMLARQFPGAEIVITNNRDHATRKYFEQAPQGRLNLRALAPGFPDRSFAIHSFNAEKDVWPFDAGSFDLVLCMEMIEHLVLDPCFLFREAHRVLSGQGRLAVTTPNIASLEGVTLALGNHAPYRFGPYSEHGEYGRHNREYVPRELPLLGEACGFATGRLTTQDVYPVHGDVAAAGRLLGNGGLPLRGQTIFYEGVKDGRPFIPYPDSLYVYQPPEHAAVLRVRRGERAGGNVRLFVEVTNIGRSEWRPDGAEATWLVIQWQDWHGHSIRPEDSIRLPGALRPGETAILEAAFSDPARTHGLRLKLDLFHERAGWFYTGKANPSEDCPSRMDRSVMVEFAPLPRDPGARRRVLIATTQVPFVRGGAEMHAEGLLQALRAGGHDAEIVAVPFKWYPPEQIVDTMLACRLLDLTESSGARVDLLIGLKFPAYLIPHPAKVLWILHQHRAAYDLWGHDLGDLHRYPSGAQVREAIHQADRRLIPEARSVYANSRNVARRLSEYCGIEAHPLYHPPPHDGRFHCAGQEEYLFFPSRLNRTKRQELVLDALARTRNPVIVRFAGAPDEPHHAEGLRERARVLGVGERAEWLGLIPEEEKIERYARAIGVLFPPLDEDYGYISLEAMLSSKPLITCTDSGGPLEFVQAGVTGLVADPAPEAIAEAMDTLWENRSMAQSMGRAARERYAGLRISWDTVVERLLSL